MQVEPSAIPDVMFLKPQVFADARGTFHESYNRRVFVEKTGCDAEFVQDNFSTSAKGVLRGLHYQVPPMAQGKLVQCVQGEIFDVAVDMRDGSPTRGQWVGGILSEDNRTQIWIPEGFAHGFLTRSDVAGVAYKVTAPYSPDHERAVHWNDPSLAIDWQAEGAPVVSEKDEAAPPFVVSGE